MNNFKNNIVNKMIYQHNIADQTATVFPFSDEQQLLTIELLASRQEEEREKQYAIKKAQEQQAKEVQDNMSLKIMRANDDLEKKTKTRINTEIQKMKDMQTAMEKRISSNFESKHSAMNETNKKLQR